MKFLLRIFLLSAILNQCSSKQDLSVHDDRFCGTNHSNLWLDIVLLVDNSKGTTENGMKNIASYVGNIFAKYIRFGSNPNNPKTIRLGLVTYNEEANVVADLDKIQSYDDLHDVIYGDRFSISASDKSYLDRGLVQAYSSLQTEDRKHYQKVIIVFTSTYDRSDNWNPIEVANSLKDSDVTIITVGCDQGQDKSYLEDLSKIATPGYNFTTKRGIGSLKWNILGALTQANCYCPPPWTQFRESDFPGWVIRYGVCVQSPMLITVIAWSEAQKECRDFKENTSQMVTEPDKFKHSFVVDLMKKANRVPYHIGLHLENGIWKWPNAELRHWSGWNKGFPIADKTMTAVQNYPDENGNVGWENIHIDWELAYAICERQACDVDNYCDSFGHIIDDKNVH